MIAALAPGATIGIIGGGQLGRMLAMAAARLGYGTLVLEPEAGCPAAQVAGRQIVAGYDEADALAELAAASDVVTYEFENVPVAAARWIAARVPVRPAPAALEMAQDRLVEKTRLQAMGISTARFRSVDSEEQLVAALDGFGRCGVLKTRRLGYDGKGQTTFRNAAPGAEAGLHAAVGGGAMILEELVAFEREASVIAARAGPGNCAFFDIAENVHRDGILRSSTVPARLREESAARMREAARAILEALDYVGVAGIEFFVLADGAVLVNEIAPRVHNSGHWTEAACLVSQFEQHVRAVCGLPLGGTRRHADCVMENLIGDEVDRVPALVAAPDVHVHLYGKKDVRAGRKMGHFTRLLARESHRGGRAET